MIVGRGVVKKLRFGYVVKAIKMKLSEAMRLGASKVEQSRTCFLRCDEDACNDRVVSACAIGCAMIGYSGTTDYGDILDAMGINSAQIYSSYGQEFLLRTLNKAGIHEDKLAIDPVSNAETRLLTIVMSLNDKMAYTVGEIADWLEGLGL